MKITLAENSLPSFLISKSNVSKRLLEFHTYTLTPANTVLVLMQFMFYTAYVQFGVGLFLRMLEGVEGNASAQTFELIHI